MDYDSIVNAIIHGEKIQNLPLRVTYYCRVSTDSDVQLNSLDNQLEYYKKYIKSNSFWTFVEGYVENGASGVSVFKRDAFKKMIRDAKHNTFDLIITKEVSRFARDLEDSVHYIRELKECNVGIFFENQNLNTFDPNSELILNIMFNIAQDESKKLSSRIKFGHRQAILKGHVLGSSNITGYRKEKCRLVIVDDEAKFVRTVFELYATGEYGLYKLAKKLACMGYYNKKGRIYDKDTLKLIITNPKYKGFYRGHTYEIMDYRTKRRQKISVDNQIIYRCNDNSIPAIVTEELWDKANNILNNRKKSYQNNNHWSGGLKYAFSSKIYCREHNTSFQRSHGKVRTSKPIWCCSLYLNHRLSSCASPIICETDLYNILRIVMNNIIPQDNNILDSMLEMYKNVNIENKFDEELKSIENDIYRIENKKSLSIDLVLSGELKKEDLKIQFSNYESELKKLIINKENLLKEMNKIEDKKEFIKVLSINISEEINSGMIDEFIREFVDEIIVSKIDNDRKKIFLAIYLNFSENEKVRQKGARHINGALESDRLYLNNQKYESIEKIRTGRTNNKYIYDVYIKT